MLGWGGKGPRTRLRWKQMPSFPRAVCPCMPSPLCRSCGYSTIYIYIFGYITQTIQGNGLFNSIYKLTLGWLTWGPGILHNDIPFPRMFWDRIPPSIQVIEVLNGRGMGRRHPATGMFHSHVVNENTHHACVLRSPSFSIYLSLLFYFEFFVFFC